MLPFFTEYPLTLQACDTVKVQLPVGLPLPFAGRHCCEQSRSVSGPAVSRYILIYLRPLSWKIGVHSTVPYSPQIQIRTTGSQLITSLMRDQFCNLWILILRSTLAPDSTRITPEVSSRSEYCHVS